MPAIRCSRCGMRFNVHKGIDLDEEEVCCTHCGHSIWQDWWEPNWRQYIQDESNDDDDEPSIGE